MQRGDSVPSEPPETQPIDLSQLFLRPVHTADTDADEL